jgi:hypothetical protein
MWTLQIAAVISLRATTMLGKVRALKKYLVDPLDRSTGLCDNLRRVYEIVSINTLIVQSIVECSQGVVLTPALLEVAC